MKRGRLDVDCFKKGLPKAALQSVDYIHIDAENADIGI